PYIEQAMEAGASGVVIGTELGHLNEALHRAGRLDLWHHVTDLIPDGKEIIYAALWMEWPEILKALAEANPRITSIGLDLYPDLPQLRGNVTPDAVAQSFTHPYPLRPDTHYISVWRLFEEMRATLQHTAE